MDLLQFSVLPFAHCADEAIAFRNLNRPIWRDDTYFDWRYRRRPCAHIPHVVWCRDASGHALGSASIIAHDFFVGDGVRPVGVIGDVSVLSQCRGQGVGARMIAALHGHPALAELAGCLVLPNDEAASAFARAHWRDAARIERFVRILDVGPRLQSRLGASLPVRGLAAAINVGMRWRAPRASLAAFDVKATQGVSFGAEHDALWTHVDKRGTVLALRDRAYLQWRYADHPESLYGGVALRRSRRLCAWVVFHIQGDVMYVDDFLAADVPDGMALVDALVRHADDNHLASTIQVNASRTACANVPWPEHGFIHRPDSQAVMNSPPLSGNGRWSGPDATPWYVTSGDKDV